MAQHFFSYILASGKKYHIEFLLKERTVFCPAASDDRHMFSRKHLADDAGDDVTGGRGVCAGFEYGRISC